MRGAGDLVGTGAAATIVVSVVAAPATVTHPARPRSDGAVPSASTHTVQQWR
jgi:hypothetical protein